MTPKTRKMLLGLGLGLGAMLATLLTPAAASGEALDRAISLASEKRYGQARTALDSVLARDPGHPLGRVLDGVLRAHEGRIGEAIEIFERLRRDHPDMPEPWNNLAVLYAAEGRFDEARETLATALARRPSAIGYANLGDIIFDPRPPRPCPRPGARLRREWGLRHGGRVPPRARDVGRSGGGGPGRSSARGAGSGRGAARSSAPCARAARRVPSRRRVRRRRGPPRGAGVARVAGSRGDRAAPGAAPGGHAPPGVSSSPQGPREGRRQGAGAPGSGGA